MSEPISTDLIRFRINNNISQYTFNIASIPVSSQQEIKLSLSIKGVITGIRVVTQSENYEISIRTQESLTTPSIKEILNITDINKVYNEMSLIIPYSCEENLYLLVTNNDSVNATGIFDLQLIISAN